MMVAFSICCAGSFNQFPLYNLDKPEMKFLNEHLPTLLPGLFAVVVIVLHVAIICDYCLIHIK